MVERARTLMKTVERPRVRFEPGDLMMFHYREGRFEFKPEMLDIRFGQSQKHGPIVNVFYGLDVMRKMMWIAKYLSKVKNRASIFYNLRDGRSIIFQISIFLPDFPIGDFAQALKVRRIMEKEIEQMKADISSVGLVKITDDEFIPVFTENPDWRVSLVGVNLDTQKPMKNISVRLPVQVQEEGIFS